MKKFLLLAGISMVAACTTGNRDNSHTASIGPTSDEIQALVSPATQQNTTVAPLYTFKEPATDTSTEASTVTTSTYYAPADAEAEIELEPSTKSEPGFIAPLPKN